MLPALTPSLTPLCSPSLTPLCVPAEGAPGADPRGQDGQLQRVPAQQTQRAPQRGPGAHGECTALSLHSCRPPRPRSSPRAPSLCLSSLLVPSQARGMCYHTPHVGRAGTAGTQMLDWMAGKSFLELLLELGKDLAFQQGAGSQLSLIPGCDGAVGAGLIYTAHTINIHCLPFIF